MKQEKIHILSLLAALVASVIFGMSFMFSKLALAVAQPSVLLAFRFTLAVAAMTLVIAVNALVGKLRGRKLFAFDLCHKPVGKLVLLGLVQPVAYFIFENYGILYTSSAVAGTIIAAPTASRAREAISVRAVGDSAAHSEATPKIALPSSSRRLKPILSPRAPIGSTIPAITNE